MADNMTMEEMLSAAQQAAQACYDSATEDWFPEGQFTGAVEIGKPRFNTYQAKDGTTQMIVNFPHRIVDGPLKGRTFDVAVFSNSPVALRSFKQFAATVLGRKPSGNFSQDVRDVVATAPGKLVQVVTSQKPRDDGSGFWNNVKYERLLG